MTGRAPASHRDDAGRRRHRMAAAAGALALLLGAGPLAAQTAAPALPAGPQPSYLPYAEFAADESAASTRLKQAYNDALKELMKSRVVGTVPASRGTNGSPAPSPTPARPSSNGQP